MTGRTWTTARQRSQIARHGRESINGKERDRAEMARIREIVDRGLKPVALVADRGLDKSAAYAAECSLIFFIGLDQFTNISPGYISAEEMVFNQANRLLALIVGLLRSFVGMMPEERSRSPDMWEVSKMSRHLVWARRKVVEASLSKGFDMPCLR